MTNVIVGPGKRYYVLLLQLTLTHKNQVPMLVGPPPKSRSFFSFLTKDLKRSHVSVYED